MVQDEVDARPRREGCGAFQQLDQFEQSLAASSAANALQQRETHSPNHPGCALCALDPAG